MEEKKSNMVAMFIIIIVIMFFWISDNNKLKDRNEELRQEIENYQTALDEANENIERGNEMINGMMEVAQTLSEDYAWSSYREMGSILEDLPSQFNDFNEQQSTVNDPIY